MLMKIYRYNDIIIKRIDIIIWKIFSLAEHLTDVKFGLKSLEPKQNWLKHISNITL